MALKRSLFIFVLILAACRSSSPPAVPLPTATRAAAARTPARTPIPKTPTATQTSTLTMTSLPPTLTPTFTPPHLTQTIERTPVFTLTPTSRPTQPTEGPGPGLIVRGYVKLADGMPLEGVTMYVAFASYDGNVVAVTNANGYYSSEYIYIPGDETIRVWAEAAGYHFKPGDGSAVWTGAEFYWRHYFGFEDRSLDFTAISDSRTP